MPARVFIYELFSGGGGHLIGELEPPGSLLREGAAMLSAVCADMAKVAGVNVSALWDPRIQAVDAPDVTLHLVRDASDHDREFSTQIHQADAVLLIAPELDGALLNCVEIVERTRVQLLSPDRRFVALTADKCSTADYLRRRSVPVPPTYRCVSPTDFPPLGETVTWLAKPVDGAGSEGIYVGSHAELRDWFHAQSGAKCLQPFINGRSASVAAICRGSGFQILPPMWQYLDSKNFHYRGGEVMTDSADVDRAWRLAKLALGALPPTVGYVGIDMVIGECEAADVVVEVNPRLTSSYLGLREFCQSNLAKAMIDAADGCESHLSFLRQPLKFSV